jgi:uncharacterized protein
MSQQENRQLLHAVFAAMAEGDTGPFAAAMAENFSWRFAGEWSWVRDWGATKLETQANLLAPLMRQFASYTATAHEIIADGDRVVVLASADATTVSGERYPQSYCYVFTLANGRLLDVVEYCDTALVERVLEMPAATG